MTEIVAAHLERAKLTKAEQEELLALASNCWDRDWFPETEAQQELIQWIDRRVAAAMAACAREEARWWSDLLDDAVWGDQAFLDQDKGRERLRALERAAGEKGQ